MDTKDIIYQSGSIYTLGGAVQAGDGLYIERKADQELLAHCMENTFAYVLTARQMGKSSLMERTSLKLREQGVHTALVDLNGMDKASLASPEVWYLDFISVIAEFIPLSFDPDTWWEEHASYGLVRRFKEFFRKVLSEEVDGQIVVFVDEIDATYDLEFADDFFAAIRSMHENRAWESMYQRISFVLIGVATPSDLIKDPRRTPFNIGESVELSDFTLKEALPFTMGWDLDMETARQVLSWAFEWTAGHPNLTQKICHAIAQEGSLEWTRKKVQECIQDTFFDSNKRDTNLEYVNTQLTRGASWNQIDVLKTYKDIRKREGRVRDDMQSRSKIHLKLHGIVVNNEGYLSVRNAIYEKYFGTKWLKEHWPINWWQQIPTSVLVTNALLILSLIGIIIQQQRVNKQAELVETAQEEQERFQAEASSANEKLSIVEDSILFYEAEREKQDSILTNLRSDVLARNDSIEGLRDTLQESSGYIADLISTLDSRTDSIESLSTQQEELEQELETQTRNVSEVSSSLQYSEQVSNVLQYASLVETELNLRDRVQGGIECTNCLWLIEAA